MYAEPNKRCRRQRRDSASAPNRRPLARRASARTFGNDQLHMNRQSPLITGFLRINGVVIANTLGRLDRYTKEHMRFLSSGFVCQRCNQILMGKWWTAGVNCYDSKGKKISIMKARLKGRYFECPKCLHRWPFRRVRAELGAAPNGGPATVSGNPEGIGGPPSVS
jgi:hypothetical protein